jgi:hypothetical protein
MTSGDTSRPGRLVWGGVYLPMVIIVEGDNI